MAAEHGTWVFGPVIDMLETVGYVPGKSIRAFPYDWRCPPCKLQERDGYFTGAMDGIEELYAENKGCKVVIIGHSMGCKMTHYFCRWVATHPCLRVWSRPTCVCGVVRDPPAFLR